MAAPPFPARFGPYVLVQPLGRGGMGQVALAMSGQPGLETLCVVKRLVSRSRARPDHVARFREEADLARRLVHPNLVQTHAVGEHDGTLYLAQEYVTGKDLSELVARSSSQDLVLPIPVSLYIVEQIARGLGYAHEFDGLGLVHRDVNPPNVRISYSGQVKLLDFGLAVAAEAARADSPATWVGKRAYLAPEQRGNGPIDRRTDLYACGIILWELLTGHPIGTRERNGEAILPGDDSGVGGDDGATPIAPSRLNAAVSRPLDAIALKALSRDPADRFQSANDLRRALEPLIASEAEVEQALVRLLGNLFSIEREQAHQRRAIEAGRGLLSATEPPAPGSAPTRAPARRRRFAIAGAALAAIVLTGAGLTLIARQRPPGVQPVASAPPAVPEMPSPTAAPEPPAPTVIPFPEPAVAPAPTAPRLPATAEAPARLAARESPRLHGGRPAAMRTVVPGDRVETPPAPPAEPVAAAELSAAERLARARAAINDKKFDAAITEARAAIAGGAGADGHLVLGNALLMSRRPTDAEREYQAVLRLEPDNAVAARRIEIARSMRVDEPR
jgi:serine/threonine protein kinase